MVIIWVTAGNQYRSIFYKRAISISSLTIFLIPLDQDSTTVQYGLSSGSYSWQETGQMTTYNVGVFGINLSILFYLSSSIYLLDIHTSLYSLYSLLHRMVWLDSYRNSNEFETRHSILLYRGILYLWLLER